MALVTSPYGPQFLLPDYMVPEQAAPSIDGTMPPAGIDLQVATSAVQPSGKPRDGVRAGTTRIGQSLFDSETAPAVAATSANDPVPAAPTATTAPAPATEKPAAPPATTPAATTSPTAAQASAEAQRAAQLGADVAVQQAQAVSAEQDAGLIEQQDIARQQQEQQARNDKIRADKVAAAAAIATKVDSTKIDPDRYWHDAGTGKKVGWLIGMVLSGIGQAMGGKGADRNPVLGMLEQVIDRDIKLQEDARAQLDKKLGRSQQDVTDFDRFSGDQEARLLARRAQAKEVLAQRIGATAAKYAAPAAAAEGAKAIADLRKSAVKDAEAAAERAFDHDMKREQIRQGRSNEAQGWARLDLDRRKSAQEDEKIAIAARQALMEGDRKKAEAIAKGAIGGDITDDGAKLLTQKSGDVFIVDDKVKPDVIKQRTAVQDLHNYLGQIKQYRETHGGTSSTTDPAAQAEYNRLVNSAIIAYSAAKGLSTADKQSQEFARDAILGDDPSKYYSLRDSGVTDRVERALTDVTASYHTTLRGLGYDGELPKFAGRHNKSEGATNPDLQRVLEADFTKKTSRPATAADPASGPNRIGFNVVEPDRQVQAGVRASLDALYGMATGSGSAREKETGLDGLTQAASNATDPTVRELAKAYLDRAQAAITPGTGEAVSIPARAVARDQLAPGAQR